MATLSQQLHKLQVDDLTAVLRAAATANNVEGGRQTQILQVATTAAYLAVQHAGTLLGKGAAPEVAQQW